MENSHLHNEGDICNLLKSFHDRPICEQRRFGGVKGGLAPSSWGNGVRTPWRHPKWTDNEEILKIFRTCSPKKQ